MADLFSPMTIGSLKLPNRIFMSAMTRTRATEDNAPTALMAEYFSQRATAGLIVTDCTAVSAQGKGVIRGPGIWRQDQIEGWKLVTRAVHDAGGRIFCQLWHCGRVAHPDMRDGELPVAPSAIPAEGDFFLDSGRVNFPIPKALTKVEISAIVADFAQATRNAREAGFDGVELHGANGYLQDQFLQDKANRRTDEYGGSTRNRARMMIETARAMIEAWDATHVGVRLGPSTALYGIDDSDKLETFSTVIKGLDALRPAYICLLEPTAKSIEAGVQIDRVAKTFRPLISVPLVVNTGFDKQSGNRVIAEGEADAVSFGVPFIANPDLVQRFRMNGPLNPPDPQTFYGVGPKGYTEYPFMAKNETVGEDISRDAPVQPNIPGDDPERHVFFASQNDPMAEHLHLAGGTYTILIGGEATKGAYCLIDLRVPPGGGPAPHRHDFEEMFYLLEGEVEVTFRSQTYTAKEGAVVNIPANAPHAFRNNSRRTARLLCMCTPAGQEDFFRQVGTPALSAWDPAPELSASEMKASAENAQRLAPRYRTELLPTAQESIIVWRLGWIRR